METKINVCITGCAYWLCSIYCIYAQKNQNQIWLDPYSIASSGIQIRNWMRPPDPKVQKWWKTFFEPNLKVSSSLVCLLLPANCTPSPKSKYPAYLVSYCILMCYLFCSFGDIVVNMYMKKIFSYTGCAHSWSFKFFSNSMIFGYGPRDPPGPPVRSPECPSPQKSIWIMKI